VPLALFKCPDGKTIPVEECLAGCSHRCLTLPTLQLIARERKWSGTPSTTQLLNGTMLEFLKITKDYVVDPQDRAFALLGTRHHKKLEEVAKELGLPAEVGLTDEERDIFDLLEPSENGWTLTDYKTWGSFKVAKALGIVEGGKHPDPSGEVYKTSGKWGKAGTVKMVNWFRTDPNAVDLWEAELQLNSYRLKLEEKGLGVTKMQLQITVRDGSLVVALSRGVERNIYLIPIRLLPNYHVEDYFAFKTICLLKALEQNHWDEPCDSRECWDGARCKGYCEVAEWCPKGILYQQEGSR